MAVRVTGVWRVAERADSSAEVLVASALTFSATGPGRGGLVSYDLIVWVVGERDAYPERRSL